MSDDTAAASRCRPPPLAGRVALERAGLAERFDVALAVQLALVTWPDRPRPHPRHPRVGQPPPGSHRRTGAPTCCCCVGPLALLAKRAYPTGTVLAVVFAATAAYALIGYPAGPVFLSLIVRVLVRGQPRRPGPGARCIASGWVIFLCAAMGDRDRRRPSAAQAAGLAAWLLVLLFAGEAVRPAASGSPPCTAAANRRGCDAPRKERLRIARELHDVLAHNISLINVQSGVALHLLDERPEQARTALAVINDASAEALREIRSVLGVLRQVDERAPRRPAASLERLPELISQSAAAGLDVDVRIDGEPRPLPSDVDLAAYRIVQESLTNVTRHARTGRASVHAAYDDRRARARGRRRRRRADAAPTASGRRSPVRDRQRDRRDA